MSGGCEQKRGRRDDCSFGVSNSRFFVATKLDSPGVITFEPIPIYVVVSGMSCVLWYLCVDAVVMDAVVMDGVVDGVVMDGVVDGVVMDVVV